MPARILILGGGFAGRTTALQLERRLRADEAEITVVSRENFQLFTPMLPEVSSGGLETRHVVTPLRAHFRRTQFVLGEIDTIDIDGKAVIVHHPLSGERRRLEYDHVVLALGSVSSTFGLPGVEQYSVSLKTLEDAERLRNRTIANLELADVSRDPEERARLLTYAFVGGGYTGVEAAGELVDLFRSIGKYYRSIKPGDVRVVVIEGGTKLLPDLPPAMGAYTERFLRRRGVELKLGDLVASVDEHGVALKSGARVDAGLVVWSAGIRPSQVCVALPLPHARNGGILTRPDFSVEGHPGVWALGDVAWIPDSKGGFYPATAQHAIREGPRLADNIVATLRGEPTKPFVWTALGTMASLGGRRGVAALPRGIVITGFLAWWLWRTYYLLRIPGLDRKVRVGLDWALGLIFARDSAELRIFSERKDTTA